MDIRSSGQYVLIEDLAFLAADVLLVMRASDASNAVTGIKIGLAHADVLEIVVPDLGGRETVLAQLGAACWAAGAEMSDVGGMLVCANKVTALRLTGGELAAAGTYSYKMEFTLARSLPTPLVAWTSLSSSATTRKELLEAITVQLSSVRAPV